MDEADDRSIAIRNEIGNYEQTVKALLAFAAFVVHDGDSRRAGSQFGFGRHMTSAYGGATRDVTPDLVAQKCANYGIVAEVKKTLDRDRSHWPSHLRQIRAYDAELAGWWTPDEQIAASDVVVLVDLSRSRDFADLMLERKAAEPDTVGPRTCLAFFTRKTNNQTFFTFRMEEGTLSDGELGKALRSATLVPLDKVLLSFPSIAFYDSPPPTLLLVRDLWMDLIPSVSSELDYDQRLRATKVPISVSQVTDELQRAHGSKAETFHQDARSVEFPQKRWVRDALDWLVARKLALRPEGDGDEYTVLYRSFRKDVLDRLIELDAIGTGKGKSKPEQTSLFQNAGDAV